MKRIASFEDMLALREQLPDAPPEPKAHRERKRDTSRLGGGQIKVFSNLTREEVRFDKTREGVEDALAKLYGRRDLLVQEDDHVTVSVPKVDIGPWIGAGGMVASFIRKIYQAKSVRVRDVAEQ